MYIRLELVAGDRRMAVYDLGPVEAPRALGDFALPRSTAHAMVAAVQHAWAGLCEEALRAKALDLCRADPHIRLKDYRQRNVPTLFGTLAVRVPRLLDRLTGTRCELLVDEARPDSEGLRSLLARLGAWMSYRYAAGFLAELFPLAGNSHPERIRRATLAAADTPALVGMENSSDAAEGSERIDLSLDTTFLRSHDRSLGRQHEVLIGHGQSAAGKRQVIGTLLKQIRSSERVSACLANLGRTSTTEVTAFTDGDKVLRMLLKQCGVTERPILDWEHIARKLERLKIIARGFRPRFRRERGIKARILATLDRINWRLWHGQREAALDMIKTGNALITRLAPRSSKARPPPKALSLRKGIHLLRDYINGQAAHLVDYGARHRAGLPIGTAPTESLANSLVNKRMNKSQQMRWSAQGAQAVITLRTAHINRLLHSEHVKRHCPCLPPTL